MWRYISPRERSQGRGWRDFQAAGAAFGRNDQARRMTGIYDGGSSGRRVDEGDNSRRHLHASSLLQKFVYGHAQFSGTGRTRGTGTQEVAYLAHGDGGIEIMADDVADTHHEPTVGKHHGVVPVTTDFGRLRGRPITGRQLEAGHIGHGPGQEATLKGIGQAVLALEAQHARYPQGGDTPELGDESLLVVVECRARHRRKGDSRYRRASNVA